MAALTLRHTSIKKNGLDGKQKGQVREEEETCRAGGKEKEKELLGERECVG